jgi:hypothetical protein
MPRVVKKDPSRVLIVNLGERDLFYQANTPEEMKFCQLEYGKPEVAHVAHDLGVQPWARAVGEAIHRRMNVQENVPEALTRCAFPILDALLKTVGEEKPIDKLLLIGTNQPEDTPASFRDRDSIYSAKIAKRHVEKNHRGTLVKTVDLKYFEQPPRREEAYRFFGDLLKPFAEDGVELHVSISGGIPALNAALQEQAFRLFRGQRCFIYEVLEAEAEEDGRPRSEACRVPPDPFLLDFVADAVRRLVDRHDYLGAAKFLDAYKFQELDQVKRLLVHAAYRSMLNWKGAMRLWPEEGTRFGATDEALCKTSLRDGGGTNILARAVETFYVMKLRAKAGLHTEVLWQARAILTATRERAEDQVRYALPELGRFMQGNDVAWNIVNAANELLHDMVVLEMPVWQR